ncbi:MAG: type II secretion system F family protein [Candidatus Hydrogenedentes bacterium]|nr:type II secretion system F family protein [Candidatus Hydrogenedentota bacterium]
MPLFRYRAVDAKGEAVTGTMDEASARRVTAILEEKGLQVSSVEIAASQRAYTFKHRLSWADIEFLNAQLIALTRSGLPISPALDVLGRELRSGKLKRVVEDLRSALDSGSSLHEALERHRGAVPPVYIAAIRAGEETGNLPAILDLCAGFSARMVGIRSRLTEALTYPIVVFVLMGFLLVYLLNNTIPQFASVFLDFGAKLPAFTQFWIAVSEVVRNNFGVLAAVICASIVLFTLACRTRQGRYAVDWLKLKTWGLGHGFNAASMARFCRSMGVLLTGKVPVDTALELASATCGNSVLEEAALDARDSVIKGTRLALAFEVTGHFSRLFCWLIEVSETRGDTHAAMLELADNYDETFARYSRGMITMIAPAILFLMAVVVVSVILGMYLPIFSLADAISGS